MTGQEVNLTRKDSAVNVTDDREAYSKFWIAAYTRPRSEKKVNHELNQLGVETYLPIQKQIRIWSDRKKYIDVPVIPMVIFIKVKEKDIFKIRHLSLITRILTLPGDKKPAKIPDKEIDALKLLLSQSDLSVSFEFGTFKANDNVIIIHGKLKGLIGQVKEVNQDTSTIWISVNLLGGSIIRIKNSDIEKIQEYE